MVVIMIESPDGIEIVDKLAAVPGVVVHTESDLARLSHESV